MRTVSILAAVALLGLSVAGHAHPDHDAKGQGTHEHDPEPNVVSEAQKDKRLKRVVRQAERRQRNRVQRSKDRRNHLRRRLGRHLKGGDATPELVAELKNHAERTAMIRQIRYIAAQQSDYETVVSADKLLARENSNHERWWRTVLRASRQK